MHDKVTVDRDAGGLRFFRFQISIQHHFVAGNTDRAFRHIVHHDTRPRNINAAVEGEQLRRGDKYHIRRRIETDHRRYGDPHLAAFGGDPRPPVIQLAPVRIAAEVDLPLLGAHHALKRRALAVKVHRQLARLHVERHKVAVNIHAVQLHLPEQLRTLRIAGQTQVSAQRTRRFFAAREDSVDHADGEVADIDVAAQISPPLRIGDLHLPVKLPVIGQSHHPAEIGAVVAQPGIQIKGVEGHQQRRVVNGLRHAHVAPGKGHFTLRQARFRCIPADVCLAAEDAAGFGGLRHKGLHHRQIEAVQVHHRAPFGPGVDSLRHAQFRIRVSPAVRPDADLLLRVAVIQRNRPIQGPWPDRGGKACIAEAAFPAFGGAIEAACELQLTGYRLALHAQL